MFSVDPLVSPPVNLPELNPEQSRKLFKSVSDIFFTVVVVTTGLVDADEGVVDADSGVTGFAVTLPYNTLAHRRDVTFLLFVVRYSSYILVFL